MNKTLTSVQIKEHCNEARRGNCEELAHLYHYHSLGVSHTNAGFNVFKIKKEGKSLFFWYKKPLRGVLRLP